MGNDRFRNPLRESTDRRLPRIAGPSSLVIFGVTGDLATRKLLPAIYDLTNRGLLPRVRPRGLRPARLGAWGVPGHRQSGRAGTLPDPVRRTRLGAPMFRLPLRAGRVRGRSGVPTPR